MKMAKETAAKPASKKKAATNALGEKLLKSAREALHAASTGNLGGITIREVEIPGPGWYGPKDVEALRQAMGASQRVFAELLGVSRELAAQWEYGIRQPAPLARRLMDKVSEDPAAFVASLVKRTRARQRLTGSPAKGEAENQTPGARSPEARSQKPGVRSKK